MTCPNTLRTGRPLSQLQHPREAIRQFTPNWFAATMGTGVLALALAQLPLRIPGLHLLAEGLWLFTIVLFVLFSAAYAARWIMFFDEARRIFGHSTVSMFFGTIPMGLATIINGFLLFGVPRWGDGVVQLAELLWWLDVALSLACGVLIPYMMFTRQEHRIDQMTAVWLLPVVAAEVAAASGGLLAPHLVDAHSQLVMLVTSYVLWAFSLPVAFCRTKAWPPRAGWPWGRSARGPWACCCWARTLRRSLLPTAWPEWAKSPRAWGWWPVSPCGGSACGGC